MAWEDCVANTRRYLAPKPVKEIGEVDWKNVSQDALDGNTFRDGDPFFLMCPDRHCVDNVSITPIEHATCRCQDASGKAIPGCTPPSYLYPLKASVCIDINNTTHFNQKSGRYCTKQGDSWYELTCYCCCSCFAYGTKIKVPGGYKKIEQFEVNDQVMTANIGLTQGSMTVNWSSASVSFSSGTGPDSHQPSMIYIHHGNTGSLIVTPDHLFLLATGKLKRADRLVPGTDYLVSAEGTPVPLNEVSSGEYVGGVHHIATEKQFNGDLSGHLLLSEGVISGDFTLQINAGSLKEQYFVPEHDSLPKIGSQQYEATHSHLIKASYNRFQTEAQNNNSPAGKPRHFYLHGEKVVDIPATAAKYLSQLQEEDVGKNAEKVEFSEVGMGHAMVQYIIKLFQGFYPEIIFYHDIGRLQPNAYAFTQYGRKIIVISGGLTRIKMLGMEGLALIVSHLINRLQQTEPYDANGYTSVGMADYYSAVIMRNIFFFNLYNVIFPNSLKQIENSIFSNISKDHEAYEEDPFAPTWETRLDAINAGDGMNFPPPQIGGPALEGLQVVKAEAFSMGLAPASFVTKDIAGKTAAMIFARLQERQILDANGMLAADFSLDTDISFLFEDQPENLGRLLTEEVRYILRHAPAEIRLSFNMPVSWEKGEAVNNYQIAPAVNVERAEVDETAPAVVRLQAALQPDVNYTLTASRYITAHDGSTMDPEKNKAAFTLPKIN